MKNSQPVENTFEKNDGEPDERASTQAIADIKPSAGGMELAITAGLFVAIGYWLDGVFGIRPILTIVLFVWAVLAVGLSLYYRYRADMKAHEVGSDWRDAEVVVPEPTTTDLEPELSVSDLIGRDDA